MGIGGAARQNKIENGARSAATEYFCCNFDQLEMIGGRSRARTCERKRTLL